MKKPYNETWIINLNIQNISQSWLKKNLITLKQLEQITTDFPESFYKPGIFVKTGLFLFTILAGSFFSGFISLFFLENSTDKIFTVISIVCAICYFFALEYAIKDRKLFHSGIDNALLYMAAVAALVPVFLTFDHLKIWQYCLIVLIVNSFLVIRYADILIAFISVAALYVMFANIILASPQLKPILPFCLMLISAIIYFLNQADYGLYYKNCQLVIKTVALMVFYLGGNYYVVREGNALLADLLTPIAPQIPFSALFYILTTTIPLTYIYFGLKNKDRILLITGLLTTAFSAFTYRYYFDIIPMEIILILAGFVLIILTISCIYYFKTARFGLSDEKSEGQNIANLEALLIAHQFGQAPTGDHLNFGGGDFGGGGAGNSY
ncbi:hypothetical protein [Dyadobacter frigoris]|uniref:DUF2157 domain-containing protein n=1 Tax=Dyadobacter frigoris TaxID=2576211 RepID=A0A4U6D233_9BACT|nr:hypothetical protein [Dyadobacter frigoris]TKT90207.1 hypothetical protein FDK13_20940 [Dyadobacter frigoris]GLU52440.1 hypothetical protein Dfri01_19010 [Dyadobacter frigoris]